VSWGYSEFFVNRRLWKQTVRCDFALSIVILNYLIVTFFKLNFDRRR